MHLNALNIILWFIPYIQILGFGIFLLKLSGFRVDRLSRGLLAFWLGYAGIVVSLQVIHFFIPVHGGVVAVFLLLSLAGFLWSGRDLRALIGKTSRGDLIFLGAAVVFVFLWILTWKDSCPVRYDTGLYHIQNIRWLTEYPTVIGLGNFHARFAYPQSYFFYASFLERAYFWMGGFYLASYLLAAGVIFEWLVGVRHMLLKRGVSCASIFRLLLIVPVIFYHCYDSRIMTASPDVAVFLMELMIMAWFLDLLETSQDKLRGTDVMTGVSFFVLSLVALTIKSSSALFVLTALVIIIHRRGLRSNWLLFAGAAGIILLPFIIRNILLSGSFLYPLAHLTLPVEWRIPETVRNDDLVCISSFAKAFDCQPRSIGDFSWFAKWFGFNMKLSSSFLWGPLGLIVFGMATGVRTVFRIKTALMVLPALLCFVGIFLFSPDCRFFGSVFWIIGMTVCAIALSVRSDWLETEVFRKGFFVVLVVVVLMTIIVVCVKKEKKWILPYRQNLEKVSLAAGVDVLRVVGDDRCWVTSLPCTPQSLEGLKLRDPKHIGAGFIRVLDAEIH